MKRPWQLKSISESAVQRLGEESGISPLLARLLTLRGIGSAAEASAFLSPQDQQFPSPFLFTEMETAVSRIQQAIERKERVLVYGDYDVDGVTATCILLETLRLLGLEADFYLPDRLDEGYGLQAEVVREKATQYSLLITVDCGTTAVGAVQAAQEADLEIIITDHHDPGNQRPPALAVINPLRQEETYPSKCLSGAGVAWKLASALFEKYCRFSENECFLDLVTLGTVADVMPLTGENRAMLSRGLRNFHTTPRPGLQALMDLAKVVPAQITPVDIGFRLAPHLNAAGRMDHPQYALKLLLTQDESEARELASHLHRLNTKRQSVETKILGEANSLIERESLSTRSARVLMVAGDGWHRGVLGIVAARLVQQYQKPVFLLSRENGIAYGSARSVDGVNLIPLLDAVRPQSISCGGHAGAAGMKVENDHIDPFEHALYEAAEQLAPPSGPVPLSLDASVTLEQIDPAFMNDLQRLEPYGEGNEEPIFYARGSVGGMGARIVGNNHLRLSLQHPRGWITAIGFGQGDKLETLGNQVEMAFACRWNEYKGRRDIDLHLKDIRPLPSTVPNVTAKASDKTGFVWDRTSLGKIYKLLERSCNEESRIALKNAELLVQLEKVSKTDFETVLTIFTEIELLTIQNGHIQIHKVENKRSLFDSKTYCAILERQS